MDNRPNLYILSENKIASDALKKFMAECIETDSEDVDKNSKE